MIEQRIQIHLKILASFIKNISPYFDKNTVNCLTLSFRYCVAKTN